MVFNNKFQKYETYFGIACDQKTISFGLQHATPSLIIFVKQHTLSCFIPLSATFTRYPVSHLKQRIDVLGVMIC